ncbi:hypothetical protein F5Y00DRAFT_153173 [Daldinia vernicosa]|uniref:uncharacterized protein n=1 Tax=Daldinia vernicosa TaxID=114800 RepID=UPI002007AC7B|nr:uncharacterized protein F5Y00DRAFT_153173 [Daldinia vernicosa]KAI0845999.1 hypothetical protein F5Y00DRAFT_153173 [Daldinia vernicosa]
MISLQASCMRSKHNILLRTWAFPRPVNVYSRSSSLSAIHRGLRDSEKARPQGFNRDSLNTAKSSRTERHGRDSRQEKPSFNVKKGKKDITYKGPEPKSRAARFYDPNEPFGKKSLVYQLNSKGKSTRDEKDGGLSKAQFMKDFNSGPAPATTGANRTRAQSHTPYKSESSHSSSRFGSERAPRKELNERGAYGSSRAESFRDKTQFPPRSKKSQKPSMPWQQRGSRQKWKPTESTRDRGDTPGFQRRDRDSQPPFQRRDHDSQPPFQRRDRDSQPPFQRRDRDSQPPFQRRDRDSQPPFQQRDRDSQPPFQRRDRDSQPPFQQRDRDSQPPTERQGVKEDEQTSFRPNVSNDHGPVRIPRTTAASQFLYGYSVVEAALKETRRQIYNLYVYYGDNSQLDSRIVGLERKASQAGIPIKKVKDTAGLRMMDKMSEGRPHNGFILEASPLPQLPIRSLGPLTEEPATGFTLELAHQTAEEAQVNGTSNFVKCVLPPNRKPFVLLLEGILDPGNLGAILRSAAFLGVNAVGITKGHTATLTSVAVKASAGASEITQLFSISSILDFLTKSKEAGWVIYAAVAPTGRLRESKNITLDRLDIYDPLSSEPTILVVGSEGEGLDKKTRRVADFEISIPNHSGSTMVDSLNVSVATAILCSGFLKNQHTGGEFDKILEVKDDESDKLW